MSEDKEIYDCGWHAIKSADLTDPKIHADMMGNTITLEHKDRVNPTQVRIPCRFGDLMIMQHPSGDQEVTIAYEGIGAMHIDHINDHQARISISPPSKEMNDDPEPEPT